MAFKKMYASIFLLLALFFISAGVAYGEEQNNPELSVQPSEIEISKLYSQEAAKGYSNSYNEIGFQFKKTGSEDCYEVYITGVNITMADNDKAPATVAERFDLLAKDIGAHFLSGVRFDILDNGDTESNPMISKYGLHIIPIDAEKKTTDTNNLGDSSDPQYPKNDANLCWAAAASNLLEYTGWANQAGIRNVDNVMDYMEAHFYNTTGNIPSALRWFFNGINSDQTVLSDGTVSFVHNSESFANQRYAGSGGQLPNYSADSFMEHYNLKTVYRNNYLAPLETGLRDSYSAVALSVYYYKAGNKISGHGLTAFGFIKKLDCFDPIGIKALFLTNSDDDCQQSLEKDRANAIDRMRMYFLSEGEGGFAVIDDYVGLPEYTTVLEEYTILHKFDSTKADTEGTHTAATTPDLLIEGISVCNKEGERVLDPMMDTNLSFKIHIINNSYSSLQYPEGAKVTFRLTLTDADGKQTVLNDYGYFSPVDGDSSALYPLTFRTYSFDDTYTASVKGTVSMKAEITGFYSIKTGDPIPEAYYTNNTYNSAFSIYVHEPGGSGDDPEVPMTGDFSNAGLYLVLVAAALCIGLIGLAGTKKFSSRN